MKRRILLLMLACFAIGFLMFQSSRVVALDFRAFYCAGASLDGHADPYKVRSLHRCELVETDRQFVSHVGSAALPAPFPGYDLALFGVLASLPYGIAKGLWGAILGLAVGVAILALIRLFPRWPILIICAISTMLIGPSLALGQIVPVYMAAACCSMLLVREKQYAMAAVAAVATMVEPHLGLPICLSLAVWLAKTRLPLAIGLAVLCLLSLFVLGIAGNIEYVAVVLPLHALSELTSDGQLSLSVILHALGFSDARALAGGTVSYVVMVVLGIAFARTAARRFSDDAFLIAVPAAAAVVGGSFLHSTDIVAAVPLVLLLLVHAPAHRTVFTIALVLLATPWWAAFDDSRALGPWFAFSAIAAFYIVWQLNGKRVLIATGCAIIVAVTLFALSGSYNAARATFMAGRHSISIGIDPQYPQASWAQVNREAFSTESLPAWLIRTPTWAALLLIAGGIAAVKPKYVRAP